MARPGRRGGNRTLRVALGLAVALGLFLQPSSATALTATESEQQVVAEDSWPLYGQGDTGENVRTIELLLRSRGYSGFEVDNTWGPNTTDAVRQFQRDQGLIVTGYVGNQTWPHLVKKVSRGSDGPAVRALQRQLNQQGADLTVDGDFGALTGAALIYYKSSRCLAISEVASVNTWHRLVTDAGGRRECFGDLPRPSLTNIDPLPDNAERYDDPCYESGHPEDNDPKPGTVALLNILERGIPGIGNSGISRSCTADNRCSGGPSEHCEGRALDFGSAGARDLLATDAADRARVREIFRWLMIDTDGVGARCDRARALGIMYMIWDSRIFNFDPDLDGAGCKANSGKNYNELSAWWSSTWRPYSCSGDTGCHRDHIHFSQTWPGARKNTAWWD